MAQTQRSKNPGKKSRPYIKPKNLGNFPFRQPRPSMKKRPTDFAQRLDNARLAKGLTMSQLADLVGCERSKINRMLREGVSPRTALLVKLSEKLEVPVTYLLGIPNHEFPKDDRAFLDMYVLLDDDCKLKLDEHMRLLLLAQRERWGLK